MPRKTSSIAPGWWEYTTLENDLLADVAKLSAKDLLQLSRPGFQRDPADNRPEYCLLAADKRCRSSGDSAVWL